jgi:hypothetical protein
MSKLEKIRILINFYINEKPIPALSSLIPNKEGVHLFKVEVPNSFRLVDGIAVIHLNGKVSYHLMDDCNQLIVNDEGIAISN